MLLGKRLQRGDVEATMVASGGFMRIAVLGLGRMGAPMARNLAEVGHQVTLYDRTRARALELGATVGCVAPTAAEAVAEAQVALTMVSDDAAEEALAYGPGGLLAHLPPGSIHLCMSTIAVETSRRLNAAHEGKGQGYVAAPVFGRPGAAVSRHLWIVAGGPEEQVTRCLGIFDALGRGLTRVGPVPELAHAAKLGGDLLVAVMLEGLSEVLAFGEKAGLPPAEFLRLLNTALFKSPLMDASGGLMVRHAFLPADLSLDQASQGTRSALRTFEETGVALPMAELLSQRLEAARARGFGEQDLSILFGSCRMEAGLEGAPVLLHDEAPPRAPAEPKAPAPAKAPRPEPPPAPKAPEKAGPGAPKPVEPEKPSPLDSYTAMSGERRLTLDLKLTTHFEESDGHVWAWCQEKRYGTSWRSLEEVEGVFRHVIFLRIQRQVLLHPETVLELKPLFGGRAMARVGEHLELRVSRWAAPRLRELLGM